MKRLAVCWLALFVVAVLLEKSVDAAPNPQPEDMWKTLMELDRMYSSIARPRFGKRTNVENPGDNEYEKNDYHYQVGESQDYFFPLQKPFRT